MDKVRDVTCRKAAVFSDIHANYHAFEACYADAQVRGADCFIFLGDYISDMADPQKTLDLVYRIREQYPTFCLRGNRERYMLECRHGTASFQTGSKTGSLLYTYGQLRQQDFAFMESLPIYDRITLNGIPFEIAHAAEEDDRYYFEGTDVCIQDIFSRMQAKFLLTGHSHKQYICQNCGKTIINPGSIGVPRDHGSLSQYAMLEFVEQTVCCELYRISYDVKAMISRQFESGLAECAPHWAVSVLYDAITGEEYTMKLLERIYQNAAGDETVVYNEQIWHQFACEMGMKFTEKEIVEFYRKQLC